MPYPSEHSARVKEPKDFESDSFRSKNLRPGIRVIIGKLQGEDSMTVQAYRFSIDNFTVEEAKKWLKDHKISYLKFESAEKESEMQHVGIPGMKWGHRKFGRQEVNSSTKKSGEKAANIVRKSGVMKQKFSERNAKRIETAKKVVGTILASGLALAVFIKANPVKNVSSQGAKYLALPMKTVEYLDLKFV